MPNLFNHNLIKTHIQNHQIDSFDEKLKVIQGWKKSIQVNKGVNEKALQAAFLQGIFGRSLGYKIFGEADEWQLSIEVSTEVDATTPDGILGFYTANESITQVVIELKSPRISLDKKQNRAGKDYGTPVDQAFGYASKYDRCGWVIVSNMNEIRLYKVGRSQEYYESFFVDHLDNVDEFKKFHLLLCKENLLRKEGQSPTLILSEKTKAHIQDISVSFYNLYKNIRIQLFEELKASNPDIDKAILVEKAQKFLDRIIFICFCEDLGLLPNDLLHHAIQRGKDSYSDSEYVVWQEIRGVFRAIDEGSTKHNIPAYNGGLFAFDEMLDNLSIKNNFFETIYEISAYDFGTDLDVNILGHIFEQSISDIEELKADVQNEAYDPQKSRRKKDGIYYTPSYITKYIVENSLGKYLEDIRKNLGEDDLPAIDTETTAQLKGRNQKELTQFYRDYEERLKQVKVLDPACGSGAFLNQAFDFLLEEYRWTHSKIAELGEGQISIFDSDSYQRSVLQNNLYGVDLNEESVEITKLSLWLKTADSRNALPYLDNNIKCGNSLIDDPEVAGDKAFRWEEEFPEIMAGGGFDVVIGNPPWVSLIGKHGKRISEKELTYLTTKHGTNTYMPNLYEMFIKQALSLIKTNGIHSFIVPDRFGFNSQFTSLRKFMLESFSLHKLTYKLFFPGIITDTMIYVVQNKSKEAHIKVKRDGYEYLHIDHKYYLSNEDYVFSYFEDQKHYDLVCKIEQADNILPLEKFADSTSGFGGKTSLITNERINDNQIEVLKGSDIGRYIVKSRHYFEFKNAHLTGRTRDENKLSYKNKILLRKTGIKLIAAYDDSGRYPEQSLYFIYNCSEKLNLKYLLALINSKLMNYYYIIRLVTNRDSIPQLKTKHLDMFPIALPNNYQLEHVTELVSKIILLNHTLINLRYNRFNSLIDKYTSQQQKYNLRSITKETGFYNEAYQSKAKIVNNLFVTINDLIITIYLNDSNENKREVFKAEIKDYYQRQYLKLYLENLTEEQLAEINQYSGNILDKVLQITIPDYDKPEVVRKVVNEWNQLQAEIADLEKEIEETDKEIDQMVYELYGLTEDEIKIVEEETN